MRFLSLVTLMVLAPGCMGPYEPAGENGGQMALVDPPSAFSLTACQGVYSSYRISYEWAAGQLPEGYAPAAVLLPTDTLAVMDHIVVQCDDAWGEPSAVTGQTDNASLGTTRLAFGWIITANATQVLQSFGYAFTATMDGPVEIADALAKASLRARVGDIASTRSAAMISATVKDDVNDYTINAFAPVDAWIRVGHNVTLVMDNATYWLQADVETSQGRLPATITVRDGPLGQAALSPVPLHANSGFEFRGSITLKPARVT